MPKLALNNNPKKTLSMHAKARLFEALSILLAALGVFLLVAFITYHLSDPGWSTTGQGALVANDVGKLGAFLSDIFLYWFGYMAYLFPLALFIPVLGFTWDKLIVSGETHEVYPLFLRFGGFLLTLFSGTALFHLYLPRAHAGLPFKAGGIIGEVINTHIHTMLNPFGAGLLFIALFLIGVTLLMNFSWFNLIDRLGSMALFAIQKIYIHIQRCFLKKRFQSKIIDPSQNTSRIPTHKNKDLEMVAPTSSIGIEKAQEKHAVPKPTTIPINIGKSAKGSLPPLSLLDPPKKTRIKGYTPAQLESLSRQLEKRLLDYGIEATVVGVYPGPVITRFELDLAPGVKVSKVTTLVKDLARSLSVSRVRVVEVIPGKSYIGLELPNQEREEVTLREVLESEKYQKATAPLSLALGKDIAGSPIIVNLEKMPHLLVAGTTGSGKSVSLNVMLLSLLFKRTPEEVRLILVDPKMLELSVYDGIPHLLTPVVTDMREAANAFRWCVMEMDRRYRLMAALGVRNLEGFNEKVRQAIEEGNPIPDPTVPKEAQDLLDEPKTLIPIPIIVLVVDELADMMMVVGKKVEELIARIAQKARAAGIHMILATQRPSVDVITGLIKSNIPTRIAFQVSSRIDSRTILDQQGAEQLLGRGDMLYLPTGAGIPTRIHGAFVSDAETHRVINDWKQRGQPDYIDEVIQDTMSGEEGGDNGGNDGGGQLTGEEDPLYDQAVAVVVQSRKASISYVQRRLHIGYNRAATLIEEMEHAGIVSEPNTNGSRQVLVPPRSD
ncbi:MAG: DNA translocase FtsK 4TM domain-containing protein [Gammaproteobacteria bacterium]|nr:DNA translocase FtsK 4TM domain-containing protein [Gammaproteobacteria bacterium]